MIDPIVKNTDPSNVLLHTTVLHKFIGIDKVPTQRGTLNFTEFVEIPSLGYGWPAAPDLVTPAAPFVEDVRKNQWPESNWSKCIRFGSTSCTLQRWRHLLDVIDGCMFIFSCLKSKSPELNGSKCVRCGRVNVINTAIISCCLFQSKCELRRDGQYLPSGRFACELWRHHSMQTASVTSADCLSLAILIIAS